MPVRSIVFWVLGIFAGGAVLSLLGLIGFLMLTEFSPPKFVTPPIKGEGAKFNPSQREFTFLTWNIGYGGLGCKEDFFYDGGKNVIPGQSRFNHYFNGILKVVKSNDTIDFIMLQEIDTYAKRSWYNDEVAGISKILPTFSMIYATNYDCRFVPMPVKQPMGRVVAGLSTCSKFRPGNTEAQYYDAYFPWPTRLVFLKRCYVLIRFKLDNGKDLVVINTHNSAFDSTGTLRKRELFILDSVMKSEYRRGNYVIAGGDWNSNPRGFDPHTIQSGDQVTTIQPPVEPGFLPGWQFVFDPIHPSNRNVDMPYKAGVTKTTIVDFFVVSPNIEVEHVSALPLGFSCSDHDPVTMKVRLKETR
ncbi:MAG: endonuclease/exonuclease/phosphatase family protein [Bacteroidales bacterium]